MTPLLISGIASIASSAIDAWTNAANRRVAVEQKRFENAMNRSLGVSGGNSLSHAPMGAPALENQLRNAPEIRSVLEAQDPSRPATLQVSGDGRIWLQIPGNAPTELTVSMETREVARQLNAARAAGGLPAISAPYPAAGSLVTLTR